MLVLMLSWNLMLFSRIGTPEQLQNRIMKAASYSDSQK